MVGGLRYEEGEEAGAKSQRKPVLGFSGGGPLYGAPGGSPERGWREGD